MSRALAVLYLAAFIDSAGIGLMMPVLPTLLRRLVGGGAEPVVTQYGLLVATFAAAQFLCAPVLGALSDRFGRRPVLLLSLAGGALDCLLTGTAPSLAVLFAARTVGGLTAANLPVISASIADLTAPAGRVRRYGTMNAAFGLGWVAGPALGGSLGAVSTALPFLVAAGLDGASLLLVLFLLPEPRRPAAARPPPRLAQLNAFATLGWLGGLPGLRTPVAVFATLCLVNQIPISLWVLHGQARYGWGPAAVGWSFAAFGVLYALAQLLLPGPATRRLGGMGCLVLGVALDAAGNLLMGLANRGWMPFAIMPLLSAAGIGMPALQGVLSQEVGESRQGELQGALAGLANLAGVAGPVLATLCFSATLQRLPGAVWFAGALGYAGCAALAGWHARRDRQPSLPRRPPA